MIKEMKTNKKMVLAIFIVAALAMVSVAAIAVHSEDNSAAGTYVGVPLGPGSFLTIDETSTVDYRLSIPVGEDGLGEFTCPITITGDAKYSGTIYIGTLDKGSLEFIPYAALKFTNASSVQSMAVVYNTEDTGGPIAFFMIGNSSVNATTMPQGTYELLQGQVMLGSVNTDTVFGTGTGQIDLTKLPNMDDFQTSIAAASDATKVYSSNTGEESDTKDADHPWATSTILVPFNGTIIVGDSSVTSQYVFGTIVALDSQNDVRLSGAAFSPTELKVWKDVAKKGTDGKVVKDNVPQSDEYPAGTLTLNGDFSIQYPEAFQLAGFLDGGYIVSMTSASTSGADDTTFLVNDVDVTVTEGSVVTIGGYAPTIAKTVTIDTGSDISVDAGMAWLINNTTKQAISNTDSLVFENVPFGSYTLIIISDSDMVYRGTAKISENGVTLSGKNTIDAGTADYTGPGIVFTAGTGKNNNTVTYNIDTDAGDAWNAPKYTFKFSADGKVGVLGTNGKNGIVSFPNEVKTDDIIFSIVSVKGHPSDVGCFVGVAGSAATSMTDLIENMTETKKVPAPDVGQIAAPSENSVELYESITVFQMSDKSNLVVKGEIDVLFDDDTHYGVLDIVTGQAVVDLINDGGLIKYMVDPETTAHGIIEDEGWFADQMYYEPNLRSAYYYIDDPNADAPKTSTYYFTSIQNGMDSTTQDDGDGNGMVYLIGDIYILVDTSLDHDNEYFDVVHVILSDQCRLFVGKDDVDAQPKFDIPATTSVITDGNHYEVIQGQARYDVQPADEDAPIADVLITKTNPDKWIYTDLATALNDVSNSGDTVEVIREGGANPLMRDATVKTGVVLNDVSEINTPNGGITIPDKKTLTVDGTLTSVCYVNIENNGTLLINGGTANFNEAAILTDDGTITVSKAGTLNMNDNSVIVVTDADPVNVGALNVLGTANFNDNSVSTVSDVAIEGKVTVADTASLTVTATLTVGPVPTISTDVVNNAVITGEIILGEAAVAKVYGDFSVEDILVTENGDELVSTAYIIYTKPYVTLYTGADNAADSFLPMLYEDQLLDITIIDWNNEKMFRGQWLIGDSTSAGFLGKAYIGALKADVADSTFDWTNVYAKWEPKKYNVIFTQTNGVNWDAHSTKDASWSNTTASGNNNGAGQFQIAYGTVIKVSATNLSGYSGTPTIQRGLDNSFTDFANGGTWTVNQDTIFQIKAGSEPVVNDGSNNNGNNNNGGGNSGSSWSDPVTILLIIIIIIIAIIAIVVAVRLLRS